MNCGYTYTVMTSKPRPSHLNGSSQVVSQDQEKGCQVQSNVKFLLTVFFDYRGIAFHEFLPLGAQFLSNIFEGNVLEEKTIRMTKSRVFQRHGKGDELPIVPVSYTHLDVYKRQVHKAPEIKIKKQRCNFE